MSEFPRPPLSLLSLPSETLINIFCSLPTLSDLYRLADTSRTLRSLYLTHKSRIDPRVCRSNFAPFGVSLSLVRTRETDYFPSTSFPTPSTTATTGPSTPPYATSTQWTLDTSRPAKDDHDILNLLYEEKFVLEPLLRAYIRVREVPGGTVTEAAKARFRAALYRVAIFVLRFYRVKAPPDTAYDFDVKPSWMRPEDWALERASKQAEASKQVANPTPAAAVGADDVTAPVDADLFAENENPLWFDPLPPIPQPPPGQAPYYVQFLRALTTPELLDMEDVRLLIATVLREQYPRGYKSTEQYWVNGLDYSLLQDALNTLDPLAVASLLQLPVETEEERKAAEKEKEGLLSGVKAQSAPYLERALWAALKERRWNLKAGPGNILREHVSKRGNGRKRKRDSQDDGEGASARKRMYEGNGACEGAGERAKGEAAGERAKGEAAGTADESEGGEFEFDSDEDQRETDNDIWTEMLEGTMQLKAMVMLQNMLDGLPAEERQRATATMESLVSMVGLTE